VVSISYLLLFPLDLGADEVVRTPKLNHFRTVGNDSFDMFMIDGNPPRFTQTFGSSIYQKC